MMYIDGEPIMLGDCVSIGVNDVGVVVADVGAKIFSRNFKQEDWGHLKSGILVEFESIGIVHYEEIDPAMKLLNRGSL